MRKSVIIEILQPVSTTQAILLDRYEDYIEIRYPGLDLTKFIGEK